MKHSLLLFVVVLLSAVPVFAQKTNDAIAKQIKSLKADKQITLTFDGSSTKVMAIAGNFDSKEASAAGIQAMNFGMAFFYPGKTLNSPADPINLTFWVLTKKPRFADAHHWKVITDHGSFDFGEARYAAKPGENMEYLNFKISRSDLAKIAGYANLKIGNASFTFTLEQILLLKNVLAVSDPR